MYKEAYFIFNHLILKEQVANMNIALWLILKMVLLEIVYFVLDAFIALYLIFVYLVKVEHTYLILNVFSLALEDFTWITLLICVHHAILFVLNATVLNFPLVRFVNQGISYLERHVLLLVLKSFTQMLLQKDVYLALHPVEHAKTFKTGVFHA